MVGHRVKDALCEYFGRSKVLCDVFVRINFISVRPLERTSGNGYRGLESEMDAFVELLLLNIEGFVLVRRANR